ncbi:MAG: peptidylprolyl isomerase [Candidatus Acidoferrales bacterium]
MVPRALVGLLAAALLLGGCRSSPERQDEVWAEVNGQPIFRSQVEAYYEREIGLLPQPLTEEEALARKLTILTELIQNEILAQKAAQANLAATEAEVEARLQELRALYSDQEFERRLREQAMTLEELREELRKEIAIRKLLDRVLGNRVEVTEQEIADYYHQNQHRFRFVETQYHVAHILVTPRRERQPRNLRNDDAVTDEQARRKVQALRERLRQGDDFADLARNYSEDPDSALAGGDLGFFPESSLTETHPALRNAVRRLQVGEVAGPLRTQDGYHLVKLLERQLPGQRELSNPEVREMIEEWLRRQKRQLLEAAYLQQARNQARVVNYLAREILESHRVRP